MAISKIVFNGVTQMDVTQKTVEANKMPNGITALKNDGTDIVGNIPSKSSSDLIVSGATVTAPAGLYMSSATKTVDSGAEGTPIAAKSAVSNHSVSITPSVVNTAGYITGGTKTGAAVTVFASDLVSGTKTITGNGTGIDVTNFSSVDVAVPGQTMTLQEKMGIVPSESSQTITPDSGYNGLLSVQINGIPSGYIGSGVTRRSSSDLTASGATVTAPSGYYATAASKTIPDMEYEAHNSFSFRTQSGQRKCDIEAWSTIEVPGYVGDGTIVAMDDSYNAVAANTTITPSTSSQTVGGANWIMEGALTVAAMPSGTAGTPTASKGTVSNHSVTVTPSVTNATGYITGGTKTGTAVSVSASELVSGTKSIYANGTGIDVTSYASVDVNVPASEPKRVFLMDYDGTVLYSYTATEIDSMLALPSNPSRSGLMSHGWNWNIVDIDEELAASPTKNIYVGQMYSTDDGKTRLYCHFQDGRTRPCIYLAVNGSVTLDFGDGSSTTVEGTSVSQLKGTYHTYSAAGDYVITIEPSEGSEFLIGGNSTSHSTILLAGSASTYGGSVSDIYRQSLYKVEFGRGVRLGSYAFYGCRNLESVALSTSVVTRVIPSYCFYNCNKLRSITIPYGFTTIGTYAFEYSRALNTVSIPNSITSIGNYAFYTCLNLNGVSIPSDVTNIGQYSFGYCYKLRSVEIPSGITTIDEGAFKSCYSLRDIEYPQNLATIGAYAFYGCYELEDIDLPSTVVSIGNNAFEACSTASSVTLPAGLTTIGNSAFDGCRLISSVTIPSSVTTIGTGVFNGCYSLYEVVLPNSMTTIGSSMFNNCYNLGEITIPSGLVTVGEGAFQNVRGVSKIILPATVATIEANAFNGCAGVKEYHIQASSPPSLADTNAFTSMPSDCIIYVPASQDQSVLNAYQTATNWSTYASYMQEEVS